MMLVAETYWQLMHNAAHWEFEITLELLTTLVAFGIGLIVKPLRRHDRKHHSRPASANYYVTRTGKVLTHADIERLADTEQAADIHA